MNYVAFGFIAISVVFFVWATIRFKLELTRLTHSVRFDSKSLDYSEEDAESVALLLARLAELSAEQLARITSINFHRSAIVSFPDLSRLRSLRVLDLSDTQVSTLMGISDCAATLITLNLAGTLVTGSALKEIRSLRKLTKLDISHTKHLNLESIKGNTSLRAVYMDGATVHNTSALLECPNLKFISAAGCSVLGSDGVFKMHGRDGRVVITSRAQKIRYRREEQQALA
jgi:Leucine-rich repeat (LRR) protein